MSSVGSLLTAALLGALLMTPVGVCAQSPDAPAPASRAPQSTEPAADLPGDAVTIFPHSESSRWWISGQANIILQWHGSFFAKYSGPNSLRAKGENATSRVLTLATGFAFTPNTELVVQIETAGGHGISEAFGLAGFTNLDVVRNPQLGPKPYWARVLLRQIIPLGSKRVAAERGPLSLANTLPERRLEIRFGKFTFPDFFDLNAVGGDSHLQFLNWGIDNNGGYDYAADTRGYTWGVILDYEQAHFAARFSEALMPKIANGIDLEWNPTRARAENTEIEFRGQLLGKHESVLRLLSYVNHANMGDYRAAIHAFQAGVDRVPDVTAHRQQGRIKYGFGVNAEQMLPRGWRAYGRFGWNEGRSESFAYTEVNQAISFGADHDGKPWRRKNDRAGGAFVLHAISGDHRQYLALGGLGFLLGDGKLTYGRERILEGYYTTHMWRGAFFSLDLQRITNPGYNRDRGPVLVPAARLHLDF
jgi:hypothetical protein